MWCGPSPLLPLQFPAGGSPHPPGLQTPRCSCAPRPLKRPPATPAAPPTSPSKAPPRDVRARAHRRAQRPRRRHHRRGWPAHEFLNRLLGQRRVHLPGLRPYQGARSPRGAALLSLPCGGTPQPRRARARSSQRPPTPACAGDALRGVPPLRDHRAAGQDPHPGPGARFRRLGPRPHDGVRLRRAAPLVQGGQGAAARLHDPGHGAGHGGARGHQQGARRARANAPAPCAQAAPGNFAGARRTPCEPFSYYSPRARRRWASPSTTRTLRTT